MSNPIQIEPLTVEVTRGEAIESRHAVQLVVADAEGRVVMAAGDPDAAVFPRSAIKILQAVPLALAVLQGRMSAHPQELSLACASHNGQADQVAAVRAWLGRIGVAESCLHCGAHRPLGPQAADALAASGGGWTKAHNNCSGKHTGFLALAKTNGEPLEGYHRLDHPVQQRILGVLEHFLGCDLDGAPLGIDGCGIPTFAMPIGNVAHAFAKLAEPERLSEDRAAAVRLLVQSIAAAPGMVAGETRFDTDVIPLLPAGSTCKVGAEGVYTAALADLGLGVAIKVQDGNPRAAEFTLLRLLSRLGQLSDPAPVQRRLSGLLHNWAGEPVGKMRFSSEAANDGLAFPL